MFVQLDDEKRIVGTSTVNCFPESTTVIEFDFPDKFDFDNQYDFLIIGGELVECESEETKRYKEEAELVFRLSDAPGIIAEQDDAICALYEENLALKSTSADTDDAICFLYEQIAEVKDNGK